MYHIRKSRWTNVRPWFAWPDVAPWMVTRADTFPEMVNQLLTAPTEQQIRDERERRIYLFHNC